MQRLRKQALACISGALLASLAWTVRAQDTAVVADSAQISNQSTVTDSASQPSSGAGPGDTVAYDASQIEYDISEKVLLLTGEGVVRYGAMTLYADTIHYMINQDLLLASGKPLLIEGADSVVGAQMVYNLKTRRGKVQMASAKSSGSHYDGRFIAKSDTSTFYIDQGDYTSCARVKEPHYLFYSRRIKVLPNNKAVARPLILNVGDAPVAALPYYILPLERDRTSGILRPRWGGQPGRGGYVDNVGYYWVPNDYMDFTVSGKVQEFENWLLNATGRYALRYWLNGYISGSYAYSDDLESPELRWSLDYSHDQNLVPDASLKLTGRGSLVSSRDIYTEFSEDTSDLLNQQISANLSLSKRFTDINASASANWSRDHDLTDNFVDENLPSLKFSFPSRPLIPFTPPETPTGDDQEAEPKWYNKIYYSYSANALRKLRYSTIDSLDSVGSEHAGMSHSFNASLNQTVFKYFNLSPNFSVRHALFDAWIDTTKQEKLVNRYPVTYKPYYEDTSAVPVDSSYRNDFDSLALFYHYADTVLDTIFEQDTIGSGVATWWPAWQTGVSLSTKLYGIFPVKFFNFVGMRHTLTPSVSYTYVPEYRLEKNGKGFEYPNIGIPYDRARTEQQQLGFSLDNLFQGKIERPGKKGGKPTEEKFTILSANARTSYIYYDDRKDWRWSDISVGANTSYNIFNVNFRANLRPYDSDSSLSIPNLMSYTISIRPSNLSVRGSLWGGDLLAFEGLRPPDDIFHTDKEMQSWNLSISPSYQFSQSRSRLEDPFTTERTYTLRASAKLDFTRSWSTSWGGYYNFETNRLEGHSFDFHCDLECWDLRFNWRPSGYNPGFYFVVGIKKHPDIKWEWRD